MKCAPWMILLMVLAQDIPKQDAAGFHTTGTLEIQGKQWISRETVSGAANGITEVKATSEPTDQGGFVTKSEYLKDGKWEPGSERSYRLAPDAQVVFQ